MGHVGNISLGSSMNNKKTMCLDGDGSILMHFGSLNDIANFAGKILSIFFLIIIRMRV